MTHAFKQFHNNIVSVESITDRVDELYDQIVAPEAFRDDWTGEHDMIWADSNPGHAKELEEASRELAELMDVLDELQGYGGDYKWDGAWYPATLISESYFEDYAREFVEDIGELPRDLPSYIVIDWEKTALNIREDYTAIDIDGVGYLYR
jgi:hypothetical protein